MLLLLPSPSSSSHLLLLLLLLSTSPLAFGDGISAYSELVDNLQRATIEANAKLWELGAKIYALELAAIARNDKVGEERSKSEVEI